MPQLIRRLWAPVLAAALIAGALPVFARPAVVAPSTPLTVTRPAWILSVTSAGPSKTAPRLAPFAPRPAASPPAEEAGAPATYILVLDDPPLASYTGGLPGLAATSPRAQGSARLDARSPEARAYLTHLRMRQRTLIETLSAAIGRPLAPERSYSHALNGLALALTPAEAAVAASLPGVSLVRRSVERTRASDAGPVLIGAAQADLAPALFAADLAPAGANPAARGRAVASYDAATRRLGLRLDIAGLSGPPADALLVSPGAGQAVAVDLGPLAAPGGAGYAGEIALGAAGGLSADEAGRALLRGELDVVVATAAAPGGEIRGRLRPARGEGVLGGVIDGGIAADHPSFAAAGGDGYVHVDPRVAGQYLGVCAPGSGFVAAFPCNNKLIGAYTFPATSRAPDPAGRPSPFDDDGHGSHTASTFAGNVLTTSSVAGEPTGPIAGVAPHAALVAYDVCGTGASAACPLDAIIAAIDQAVADGVAVANFSISGIAGDPWSEPDALAFLGALDAGMLTSVAAGNSGPAPGTIGAPANAPWVMAVAASTHARRFSRVLGDFAGGAVPAPPPLSGAGFGAAGLAPTRILDAALLRDALDEPNPYCLPFERSLRLEGAIVVCRQSLRVVAAVQFAAAAGAGGVVIIWPDEVGDQLPIEALPLPVVQLDSAAGAALRAWLAAGSGHTASISPTTRTLDGRADAVAWFSARGPNRLVPDVLKPDLAAPGVGILAATTADSPGAAAFALLSGTSMAAPHAAGAAALLRQLHPDWTAQEIRSALMTTAAPALSTASGASASPFDAGAGRVRVGLAARAGLLLDESSSAFRAANPQQGGDPSTLNLPALGSGDCVGECVFTRTVRNALAMPATWTATTAADPLLTLAVRPERFTLAPGARQTLVITASVTQDGFAPPGSYRFGAVTLAEENGLAPSARLSVALDAPSAVLPPAIVVRAQAVTGATESPPLRTAPTDALTLRVLGPTRGERRPLLLGEDPTPSDPLDTPVGVATTTIEVPRGSPRVVVAVQNTSAPDVDLFVFADGEGGPVDGKPQEDELVCISAGFSALESCDLTLDGRGERRLIVLLQGYAGSGATEDPVDLLVAVVPDVDGGTLRVDGPPRVRAGAPFSVEIAWAVPNAPESAGRHLAALQLSSSPDPANAGDLGVVPLDLISMPRREYVPMLWKPAQER